MLSKSFRSRLPDKMLPTKGPAGRTCCRCLHQTRQRRNISPLPQPPSRGGELAKIIRDSIKATGPIPVSQYIQLALSHPFHGYYARGDVFGRKGDFITSPEISQIFGELMAIWLLTRYMAAGSPGQCRIIELGPGRGTLMDDVLRTFQTFPAIGEAIESVYLIENSEKMRALQAEKLESRCKAMKSSLEWSDKVDEILPYEGYTMIIAHEFFDAMPINVFEKSSAGWREVLVSTEPTYDPSLPTTSTSGLRLSISREPNSLSTVLPATSPRFATLPLGSRTEISQECWKITRKLGELLNPKASGGGAGLIVDYGGEKAFGNSFRAFRNHKIVDVFDNPGSADLTANVDFAYLQESLSGTGTTPLGPIPQSTFLTSLGLQPRLEKLLTTARDDTRREDIRKAAQRLIDPLGMGAQYQVLGLSGVLPGKEEEEVYPFLRKLKGGGMSSSKPGETVRVLKP